MHADIAESPAQPVLFPMESRLAKRRLPPNLGRLLTPAAGDEPQEREAE